MQNRERIALDISFGPPSDFETEMEVKPYALRVLLVDIQAIHSILADSVFDHPPTQSLTTGVRIEEKRFNFRAFHLHKAHGEIIHIRHDDKAWRLTKAGLYQRLN